MPTPQQERENEELASTRLSLELGKVGIQSSSPCSSAGGPRQQQQQPLVSGYGPRSRQILTQVTTKVTVALNYSASLRDLAFIHSPAVFAGREGGETAAPRARQPGVRAPDHTPPSGN
jgi:hypothetical protein